MRDEEVISPEQLQEIEQDKIITQLLEQKRDHRVAMVKEFLAAAVSSGSERASGRSSSWPSSSSSSDEPCPSERRPIKKHRRK